MKKSCLIFFLFINIQICFPQEADSIINILNGKWNWDRTYFWGREITPADSGYTITIEFVSMSFDSVHFYLYKNDTLEFDTTATILHGEFCWGISKSVMLPLSRYFQIMINRDYLGVVLIDINHLQLCDDGVTDGYLHYFDRIINQSDQPYNEINSFLTYPNPFTNKIIISIGSSHDQETEISIFNCSLKCIHTKKINIDSENYTYNIEGLDSFSPGIYFIRIVLDEKVFIRKIIKP